MIRSEFLSVAVGAAAALAASAAAAVPINVVNFSFEDDVVPSTSLFLNPTGWTAANSALAVGVANPANLTAAGAFADDLPDGIQSAFSNGPDLFQVLGDVAQVGTYTLSVGVGNRPDNAIPDHTINLFAGSTLLATNSGTGTGGIGAPISPNVPGSPFDGIQGWTDLVATGTLGIGDTGLGDFLRIELVNQRTGGFNGGEQIHWDNVRLDFVAADTPPPPDPSVVPLPAGLPLLAAGLGAFGLLRRARRSDAGASAEAPTA